MEECLPAVANSFHSNSIRKIKVHPHLALLRVCRPASSISRNVSSLIVVLKQVEVPAKIVGVPLITVTIRSRFNNLRCAFARAHPVEAAVLVTEAVASKETGIIVTRTPRSVATDPLVPNFWWTHTWQP